MFVDLLKPETFDFFAKYFISGYLIIIIRSYYVVGEKPKATQVVAESVILSLLNQLIFLSLWSLLSFSISFTRFELPDPTSTRIFFFLQVGFLPVLLGILSGANLSKGWRNAVFRRLSMPISNPTQRAHDFAFGNNRDACFVIVTYDDGTVVKGFFGTESLAASDTNRSDLYLERLYIDKDDQWIELNPGRSALLSLAKVRSIEFLDQTKEDEGDDNAAQ